MDLVWKLHFALILTSSHLAASLHLPQTAKPPSAWFNLFDGVTNFTGSDGLKIPILVSGKGVLSSSYTCGFFQRSREKFFFGVAIAYNSELYGLVDPELVWHANGKPVKRNATLQLTSEGGLILRDADGTLAWSSNTTGKFVASLNMSNSGNLILSDVNNVIVWQSFDHPTDTLLQDQILVPGQELRPIIKESNWRRSLYSLSVTRDSLLASVKSNPPQIFFENRFSDQEGRYVQFRKGSLSNGYTTLSDNFEPSPAQFLRMTPDGHLKVYENRITDTTSLWIEVGDLLTNYLRLGECNYPLVCGRYGICNIDRQCICPPGSASILSTNYFKLINEEQPNQGCSTVIPLTCNASKYQSFITLNDVTYFSLRPDINDTDVNYCREACLHNCSCKAAVFYRSIDQVPISNNGSCYLATSDIFSFMKNNGNETRYISTTLIKVQNTTNLTSRHRNNHPLKVGIALGCSLFVAVFGVLIVVVWRKRNNVENEEDYLDIIPGMPFRFSFEELRHATENFTKKLGQGGFGLVFEGILGDGTKIAVKCLNEIGHAKLSFLAEVESIGSIHQVNLVRLVGFCAEKTHRLLVYEYMAKGSLDKWIYNTSERIILDWECRCKIIHDIAKGLAYLHDECRQKIVHLDIKPQNILLDEDWNAKLSDFGLAKLIDRKQSKVITKMRGTPGYLAPEWLSGVVTEKLDVYSFGVVLLEFLCGRKHYDESEPEECRHLLSLFKVKAQEGKLSDLIDKHSEDMKLHGVQVEEMMRVAAWCLISDYRKRPSMSMVVKVLEGGMEVEADLDYNLLLNYIPGRIDQNRVADSTPPIPSILTGPR